MDHWSALRQAGVRVKRRRLRLGSQVDERDRPQAKSMHPTTVSVIVPVYNVEAYLDECLKSVREQQHRHLEILVIDDGSPDGSAAIAEKHAAEDPRVRVIHQENGGLGAARNTGIRHATGDFFCFVDSDDVVPVDSVARMVRAAKRSGSDIVAGAALRFNSSRRWRPDWVDLHARERLGFRVADCPGVIRNNYTWGKLYRASFWRTCDLWFREGVSYEDQPIITQLFVRANGIDIIPTITYWWRQRDDQSSISQQMHTLRDLKDRVSAWDESHTALSAEAPPIVYATWLTTLFATHLHWYLNNESTGDDDEYWNTLQETVERVTTDAPESLTETLQPQHRVAIELTRLNLREEFHEFKRLDGYTLSNFRGRLTTRGVTFELPTYGSDLAIPEEMYVLRDRQIPLMHRVDRTEWTADGSLRVEGWAYFRFVDLTNHYTTITLRLCHERTGEVIVAVGRPSHDHTFLGPLNDKFANYEEGSFVAELPIGARLAASPPEPGDIWALSLRVQTDRLDRTVSVTRVNQSGSGRFLAPLRHAGGFLHRTDLAQARPFKLQYRKRSVSVDELKLDGSILLGRLNPPTASRLSLTSVASAKSGDVPIATTADGRFSISLPSSPPAEDQSDQFSEWSMRAQLAGRTVPVSVDANLVEGMHGRSDAVVYSIRQSHRGAVLVQPSHLMVELSHAAITGDVLVVSGVVATVESGTLTLSLRAVKATSTPVTVDIEDGGFTARIPFVYSVWRYGEQALPSTGYTLRYELRFSDGTTAHGDAQVSHGLTSRLPCTYESSNFAVTMTRASGRALHLHLVPPVGPAARGAYHRNCLEEAHKAREGSEHLEGLLIETNFGEIAGDNGIAVQQELQRRDSHLRVYWAVKDRSVIVPDGGIPVIRNSREWYERLRTAKYLIDNMYQPGYHNKPPGQVVIQTFHGYPFKVMGHRHWEKLDVSRQRIELYDRRTREWDYLVSPARYATPLLRRDFSYDGEVLEIGYPRNDVLSSSEAPAIRAITRKSLGIAEDVTVVLYAPTFRDYLSQDDHRARMGDFLDAELLADYLGNNYVLLIRGHAFHARTSERSVTSERIIDVTDYPDPADLYLASDLAVLDYSSLRFDYALTGKPMLFLVPDLDLYENTRGWLLDYSSTAPGPLLKTTDEIAAAIKGVDAVVAEYGPANKTFRETYLDLEDGQAAARLVEAVFVPRGDASPRR